MLSIVLVVLVVIAAAGLIRLTTLVRRDLASASSKIEESDRYIRELRRSEELSRKYKGIKLTIKKKGDKV